VLEFPTGHWVSHEAAGEFNAALLSWLDLKPVPAAPRRKRAA
jgi:hypothetical protein